MCHCIKWTVLTACRKRGTRGEHRPKRSVELFAKSRHRKTPKAEPLMKIQKVASLRLLRGLSFTASTINVWPRKAFTGRFGAREMPDHFHAITQRCKIITDTCVDDQSALEY